MKPRSNLTTIVLVVALLGVVGLVSSRVNPPPEKPHDHAEETASADPAVKPVEKKSPEELKQEMEAQKKVREEYKNQQVKAHQKESAQPKKAFNPDSIDPTTGYWQENGDGAKGTEQLLDKVAVAKEQQRLQRLKTPPQKSPTIPPPPGGKPASEEAVKDLAPSK